LADSWGVAIGAPNSLVAGPYCAFAVVKARRVGFSARPRASSRSPTPGWGSPSALPQVTVEERPPRRGRCSFGETQVHGVGHQLIRLRRLDVALFEYQDCFR